MDNRPNWDELFMEECKLWSRRSTCMRIQTGAVLVKDKRTISTGYNGVCTGDVHCVDYWEDERDKITPGCPLQYLDEKRYQLACEEFKDCPNDTKVIQDEYGREFTYLEFVRLLKAIPTSLHFMHSLGEEFS